MIQPLEWLGDRLKVLDQTRLPQAEAYLELRSHAEVVAALKRLSIRGAPAIGIATAYGIALGALFLKTDNRDEFLKSFNGICADFAYARPTAVNLFHAIDRMKQAAANKPDVAAIKSALVEAATALERQEEAAMSALSRNGAELLEDGFTVLTHCNTGQLATGVSYGTALGVMKYASEKGKKLQVYADETRPLLQGSRLTAWELQQLKIPFTLITDNMAGHFISRHSIDCVLVGADRIAANGDTANKIGTYTLAVLARDNNIPFYVAAPVSTIDPAIASGDLIPIEQRDPSEVLALNGSPVAPAGARAANPAFDVTPHRYLNAIITERGIIKAPFQRNIHSIFEEGR